MVQLILVRFALVHFDDAQNDSLEECHHLATGKKTQKSYRKDRKINMFECATKYHKIF